MRVLFTNRYSETQIFDDVEEFLQALNDEDISMEPGYGYNVAPKAEYIPDDLKPVEVKERENVERFYVEREGGDIPPPLPGESVIDYAKRLTNG